MRVDLETCGRQSHGVVGLRGGAVHWQRMWSWQDGWQSLADDCRLSCSESCPGGVDRCSQCGPAHAWIAVPARLNCRPLQVAPWQRRSAQPLPTVTEVPRRQLTPRRATWLVLRPSERATAQDHQQLTQQAPELAAAVALAQDFASLVRQRQPTQLEPWLRRAATSSLPSFRRFAKGLREDDAAVKAGVTLPWSQGPIEGQINRLKMLKRQMFGRARLDLLARRFLLVA
jgi:transposase